MQVKPFLGISWVWSKPIPLITLYPTPTSLNSFPSPLQLIYIQDLHLSIPPPNTTFYHHFKLLNWPWLPWYLTESLPHSEDSANTCGTECSFIRRQHSYSKSPRVNGYIFKIKWSKWKSLSRVPLFATPWTIRSMKFSRPEYGVGSLSLLQGIFPTQRWNPGLLHCRRVLYQLSHKSLK